MEKRPENNFQSEPVEPDSVMNEIDEYYDQQDFKKIETEVSGERDEIIHYLNDAILVLEDIVRKNKYKNRYEEEKNEKEIKGVRDEILEETWFSIEEALTMVESAKGQSLDQGKDTYTVKFGTYQQEERVPVDILISQIDVLIKIKMDYLKYLENEVDNDEMDNRANPKEEIKLLKKISNVLWDNSRPSIEINPDMVGEKYVERIQYEADLIAQDCRATGDAKGDLKKATAIINRRRELVLPNLNAIIIKEEGQAYFDEVIGRIQADINKAQGAGSDKETKLYENFKDLKNEYIKKLMAGDYFAEFDFDEIKIKDGRFQTVKKECLYDYFKNNRDAGLAEEDDRREKILKLVEQDPRFGEFIRNREALKEKAKKKFIEEKIDKLLKSLGLGDIKDLDGSKINLEEEYKNLLEIYFWEFFINNKDYSQKTAQGFLNFLVREKNQKKDNYYGLTPEEVRGWFNGFKAKSKKKRELDYPGTVNDYHPQNRSREEVPEEEEEILV